MLPYLLTAHLPLALCRFLMKSRRVRKRPRHSYDQGRCVVDEDTIHTSPETQNPPNDQGSEIPQHPNIALSPPSNSMSVLKRAASRIASVVGSVVDAVVDVSASVLGGAMVNNTVVRFFFS